MTIRMGSGIVVVEPIASPVISNGVNSHEAHSYSAGIEPGSMFPNLASVKNKHCYPHIYVPNELCEFVLKNKFVRPMQLYIHLKGKASGMIKLTDEIKGIIGKEIGLKSKRAVSNNLKLLVERGWIGFDKQSGYYFIRNFESVKKTEGLSRSMAAEFYFQDIKKLKAFLCGAVIAKLIRSQKRQKRELERLKGRSYQCSRNCQNYYPVANMALAKILNITISTAFELKKLAAKSGYIKIKKNFQPIAIGSMTQVNACYKNYVKAANPARANVIRVRGKFLYLQRPDLVLATIRLKFRRKKSKHT